VGGDRRAFLISISREGAEAPRADPDAGAACFAPSRLWVRTKSDS
jgi:hypothetical protein